MPAKVPTTTAQAPQAAPQAAPARDGASPQHTQLRGASFAEGESLLSPGPAPRRDAPAPAPGASVDAQMPSQVSLQNLSVSFTLPAGKTLAGAWTHEVRTSAPTQVTLSVSREGVALHANPGIFIDAQWPAQNMRVGGAGRNFAQGRTYADVYLQRGLGEGFVDLTGRASAELTGLIDRGLAGTRMAERGYDPFRDDQVLATLGAIKSNFESLPDAGGGGAGVAPAELTRPTLSATLKMNEAFEQASGGAGVRIPAGGAFSAEVVGQGNLGALLAARTPGQAASAVPISAIHLTSQAIELTKGGEPVARLDALQVARGGQVSLTRFTLLGSGRTAAGVETLIRLLAGVVQASQYGVSPEVGVQVAAQNGGLEPRFVEGLSRQMIEEGLTTAVRSLVTSNRGAIPGLDLAAALGLGG